MEKAVLVGIEEPLDELCELAAAAGAEVAGQVIQRRERPDPALFIGRGKADQLQSQIRTSGADLVIFDEELSPSQTRNLERLLETKVVDRTGLILDIFARRARTREGKLQVELAQLNYRFSRLAGGGEWLSRLGGGIGTRGPGETKLEVDRRRIRARIAKLKRETGKVRQHRRLHRDRRRRNRLPTVSLVGYTNAGKSTLFARLSGEEVLVSRQLFATLDPLIRRIRLPSGSEALVADTVGFIRKLPHTLVDAFRATLEEVVTSDLVVHVTDISDPDWMDHRRVVERVLEDLGAGDQPRVRVYNKVDQVENPPHWEPDAILISALTGQGLQQLRARIAEILADHLKSAV